MVYEIALGNERYVPFKDRVLAGKETKFVFKSSEYPLDELQVTVTNGEFIRRHTVKDQELDLSRYITKASVVEVTVDLILRGVTAKTWVLEPLVVRENGGQYILIPEVALLRAETKRLRKAMRELKSTIKETM
jgi:hypothetical protein